MKIKPLIQTALLACLGCASAAHANDSTLQCSSDLLVTAGADTRIDCAQDLTIGAGTLTAEQSIDIITAGDLLIESGALLTAPNVYIRVGGMLTVNGMIRTTGDLFITSLGTYPPTTPSILDAINQGELAYSGEITTVSTESPSGGITSIILQQLNVPEPGTYSLMAMGLCALGLMARKRHQA